MAGKKKVTAVEETLTKVQVNLYRGMNKTPVGGAKITYSVWTDSSVEGYGRKSYDVDFTADLTPDELAAVIRVLDIAEKKAEEDLGLV